VEEYEIKSPSELIGDFTICGACPDMDLVMMKSTIPNTEKNENNFFDMFNKDEEIYGDVVIVKTDTMGSPIDFYLHDYKTMVSLEE
tara:strand:- start:146 stop:403 length:258 start_codon:yes stop_codon:yes gene_type:complete